MPPKKSGQAALPLTTDSLPSTTLISNAVLLRRILSRLPKDVIVDLVLIWLDHPLCPIHESTDDDDDYFVERETVDEKKAIYESYRDDPNTSRKMVVDKVLGSDWRRGLNVLQVAMLDMQHLFHLPTAQKWIACDLNFVHPPQDTSVQSRPMPSLRPTLLVQQLRKSINPLLRNHIYIQSHPHLPLLIIRIQLTDGGIKDDLLSPRRTFFLAIPSSSPSIFHTPTTDLLQEMIRQTLSKVFSTVRFPVTVSPTTPAITSKTLETMMTLCGTSREKASLGAWRIYAKGWVDGSPLAPEKIIEERPPAQDEKSQRKDLARARFGMKSRTGNVLEVNEEDGDDIVSPALERVEFKVVHEYPDDDAFSPSIMMRFEGTNVFHGIYQGVMDGWVDGKRVPGWLTGEEGRSEGRVENGRIVDM